jgi:hypothetical protein
LANDVAGGGGLNFIIPRSVEMKLKQSLLVALLLGTTCSWMASVAHAEDWRKTAEGREVDCSLKVKGKTYLKGTCMYDADKDGSFRLFGDKYFVYLNMLEKGVAGASWNGKSQASHAQELLGEDFKRKGGCWVGKDAEICALHKKQAAKPANVAASASPAAVDAVRGFYQRYLAAFAKDAATPDIAMSKAFKADIQKSEQACKGHNDEVCGWGSDSLPYLSSQDPDNGLNFKNSAIRFTQAKPGTVQVDLNVNPSAAGGVLNTILFKMVQENGQWVADDILYPDGKSTYSTRKGLADERAGLAERIKFAKGAVSATVSGKFSGFDDQKSYVIGVGKGQTMTVEQLDSKSDGDVSIYITDPKGENANDMDISCHSNATVEPTIAGDYNIQVVECKKADPWKGKFAFKVTVK